MNNNNKVLVYLVIAVIAVSLLGTALFFVFSSPVEQPELQDSASGSIYLNVAGDKPQEFVSSGSINLEIVSEE